MGQGLDRRPAVPVAAEDRRGQREQLQASPLEVTTTPEPPRAEVGSVTRCTLHHAGSVATAATDDMADMTASQPRPAARALAGKDGADPPFGAALASTSWAT